MKAIETKRAGCHFRSRLEARWSVFFDELGIEWQYEPEGFEYEAGDEIARYLPDFYLPRIGAWVEVKGSQQQLERDAKRIAWACDFGSPLEGVDWSYGSTRGLLVLGDIPRPATTAPWHLLIQHHKNLWFNRARFTLDDGGRWDLLPLDQGRVGGWQAPYGDASWHHDLSQMNPDRDSVELCAYYVYNGSNRYAEEWAVQPLNAALTAARSARFGR